VSRATVEFSVEPDDTERLANLSGPFDEHLRQIELQFAIELGNRGNLFRLSGDPQAIAAAQAFIEALYARTERTTIHAPELHLLLNEARIGEPSDADLKQEYAIRTKRGVVRGRGPNQQSYLKAIQTHDLSFGVGPAGTGKTYLAVACAVEALAQSRVQRLVLVRPAVEAGEKLGFLPGDLTQKVDPYLRPLYDALYEMLGFERVAKLQERSVIEVAPLAFMRGRTLNDAFIILDEAQNTTVEQMKMFLTRIGFGATAVVTGDMTQVDLPKHQASGLKHALDVLRGVEGVSRTFLEARDVVRHPLVKRIVEAYERHDARPQA
jgi:phosphate starvation-inducible protein PhoH and related proteins